MKSREDVVHGLANFPATLLKLFSGRTSASWCFSSAADVVTWRVSRRPPSPP